MLTLDDLPNLDLDAVPVVDRTGMVEVDRLMIEEFGILLIQMMENAGLQLADLVRRYHAATPERPAVVLCGRGNNGGGGLAAARRLHAWGVPTRVVLAAAPGDFAGVPATQLAAVRALGVPLSEAVSVLPEHGILVDAVIGYGLRGPLQGAARELITTASASPAPVVSLDVPSGLDVDSGVALGPALVADATMTLALPKAGLLRPGAERFVGTLYLADIGVPGEVYSRLGLAPGPLFREGPLVCLLRGA